LLGRLDRVFNPRDNSGASGPSTGDPLGALVRRAAGRDRARCADGPLLACAKIARAGGYFDLLFSDTIDLKAWFVSAATAVRYASVLWLFRLVGLVVQLLASGRVRQLVDRVFPVSEAADAFDYLGRPGKFGKVLLAF
jgi:Zinc-binding dehydrogenase